MAANRTLSRKISLKTPDTLPGTVYRNGNRYWWKVQLPGESQPKPRPLKPAGAKFATSDPDVAIATATLLWEKAVFASSKPKSAPQDTRLASLVQAYHAYNKEYFRDAHGRVTNEPDNIKYALDFMLNFVEERVNAKGKPECIPYATLEAEEFDVAKLYCLQQAMVAKKLTRNLINKRISMIRRMFKWAAGPQGGQRIPAGIYHSLLTLDGLRKGRCQAKESRQIKPVPEGVVFSVLPYTTSIVATMMKLQLLTGMRSGELCDMRPGDIDLSKSAVCKETRRRIPIWVYTPTDPDTLEQKHKTAHRNHARTIALGPKAQDLLRPYLLRSPESYCFSPAESERQRLEKLNGQRKTPSNQGNRPGSNRRANPQRCPGHKYDRSSYYRAVRHAIQAARKAGVDVPDFHPHQLRHTTATCIRQALKGERGLEAASATLGHRDINTTLLYAEINQQLAIETAVRFG